MRDLGLARAIEAAGGVAALARGLGIAQPSVSGWSRVPADRVAAVESFTGVTRETLRPDLFEPISSLSDKDPLDRSRARHYLLLATLLRQPPSEALLSDLASLTGDASPIGMATIALADAARATSETAAGEEYFRLFVGVGRGEVLPYASFYLTGFLHERPLQRVREDLERLGIERNEGTFDPEDHVATLLEVTSGLLDGTFGGGASEAATFFKRHLKPWVDRLLADITISETARFYRAVAGFGAVWIAVETTAHELPA